MWLTLTDDVGPAVNRQAAALAGALADRGHHITVYAPVDDHRSAGRVQMAPEVEVQFALVGVPGDPEMPVRYGALLQGQWRASAPDVAHAFAGSQGSQP